MKIHPLAMAVVLVTTLCLYSQDDDDPFGPRGGKTEKAAPSRVVEQQIPIVKKAIQKHFGQKQVRIESGTRGKQVELNCLGAAVKGHRVSVRIAEPGTVVTAKDLKAHREWLEALAALLKDSREQKQLTIPKTDNLASVGKRSFTGFAFGPEAVGEDVFFTTTDGSCDISVSVTGLATEGSVELTLDALKIARAIDKPYQRDANKAALSNPLPPRSRNPNAKQKP